MICEPIPISLISKRDHTLFFFHRDAVTSYERIDSAFIVTTQYLPEDAHNHLYGRLNQHLSQDEKAYLQCHHPSVSENLRCYRVLLDVTSLVKKIASGSVENNGIIIENLGKFHNLDLVVNYKNNAVYPHGGSVFYEKEFSLCSPCAHANTPWIYTGSSDTITFFIYNDGCEDITVHLENSPNGSKSTTDAQTMCICPGETVDLVPYRFSKFMRLVAKSDHAKIRCTIWFQTQLKD